MVRLNFVVRCGRLVLRISEGRERYIKHVGSFLQGNYNLEKQWDSEKQRFIRTSPCAKENNAALQQFKSIFANLLISHPEFTARQVSEFYS